MIINSWYWLTPKGVSTIHFATLRHVLRMCAGEIANQRR